MGERLMRMAALGLSFDRENPQVDAFRRSFRPEIYMQCRCILT